MAEPAFFDPYDNMTDEQFQAHMDETFGKDPMTSINLRIPFWLLGDVKAVAHDHKVPHQKLIKLLITDGVKSMQRRKLPATTATAARKTRIKAKV